MRWDNLRLDEPLEAGEGGDLFTAPRDRALPLIERGAVARTFDTPGFRGMTFFEVQAKSVVNRVPEASRMPFKWTINPYRGCQHACVYCLEGETPILMADGRTRPLAQLRAGDGIYGTVRRGGGREYVRTTVLAHWSTVKPAYRVLLEDGTQLVCSGDHRFLTERGWRYVTGGGFGGLRRRPHLSAGHALMGTGGFAEPPKQTAAYRRGYLCGLIRGDGSDGHYAYPQLDRPADRTYLFRLPLAGQENREGLARTAGYLARAGIGCVGFSFTEETGTAGHAGRRELTAVRTGSAEQVRTLSWLLDWPDHPAPDWHKGFLAGIFDAHGSYRDGVLRLAPADPAINGWLVFSLESLGFGYAVERPAGRACVRVRGGLGEALRFFHTDRSRRHRAAVDRGRGGGDRRRPPGDRRRAARAAGADVRHHHRDRRLHRQRRGESQLLRQEVAHLPGLRRGRGLQHPGGGQGQRARAGPQEDGLAELAGRAHFGGHERGLLPAGGGALPADARHHPRAQGRGQPVLHPDQGHADPQGHRPARRGRRGHRGRAQRLRGLCRQRPMAINRAGHARARRGGWRRARR